MATRFEIVLHGDEPMRLRGAAEEALDEVDRLEAQLSLYRAGSELSQLNQRAGSRPVRVAPNLFRLLQQAQRLSAETSGAFDITVAPLMRCWGFMGGAGQLPDAAQLEEARACVGMSLVHFDENEFTIQFARPGVMLDLGAIGKGYALERATDILREAGITSALLHGGTSTVYALGTAPAGEWQVAIENPQSPPGAQNSRRIPGLPPVLAKVALRDQALSVSAVWGKSFTIGERTYGHVIDPRTGQPTAGAALAAVVLPSATETDALSTALLTLGKSGNAQLSAARPGARLLVVARSDAAEEYRVDTLNFTETSRA